MHEIRHILRSLSVAVKHIPKSIHNFGILKAYSFQGVKVLYDVNIRAKNIDSLKNKKAILSRNLILKILEHLLGKNVIVGRIAVQCGSPVSRAGTYPAGAPSPDLCV